jgi:hypothetical protein
LDATDFLAAEPATAAFVESEAHTLFGRPLAPFSIRRQIAAQALGNRLLCGRARMEPPMPCPRCAPRRDPACPVCEGTGERHGTYDGQFADVVGILYLCVAPDAESLRAVRDPVAVFDAAFAWAERESMTLGSRRYLEACKVFFDLLSDLQRAQFTVEGAEGDDEGKKKVPVTATSRNTSP